MPRNKPQAALPELKGASADIEAGEATGGGGDPLIAGTSIEERPTNSEPSMADYLPVKTKMGLTKKIGRRAHLPVERRGVPEVAVTIQGHRASGVSDDQVIITRPLAASLPEETIRVPGEVHLLVEMPRIPEGASTNQASKGSKDDGQPEADNPRREMSSLSIYLQNQLQSLESNMVEKVNGAKSKIQKVHPRLREKKDFEKYYNPEALPLGPIHHKENGLRDAERLKLNLASHFIKENDVNKEELCSKILMKIEDLKECYAADVLNGYVDDELTWIFLVDGCAILCFIQCLVVGGDGKNIFFRYDELEALNIKIDRIPFILRDLFLLENQLPYQLLLVIISVVSQGEKLIYCIKLLVAERAGAGSPPSQEHVKEEPNHLLDFLRDFLIVEPGKSVSVGARKPKMACTWPNFTFRSRSWVESAALMPGLPCTGDDSSLPNSGKVSSDKEKPHNRLGENNKEASYSNQHTFRNVTELKASGVGFKRSETNSLKAISFHPGWFLGDVKLPFLRISDDSAPILLNLVAYEMCPDFKNEYEVTSYICFLDSLIDQPEDVAELRKAHILHNLFGSDEEVAKLFNEIGTDLVPNPRTYLDVKEQIDGVYRNKWKVWLAQFLNDRFNSPWSVLVFVGAIIALVVSFLQTWYTVNPKK